MITVHPHRSATIGSTRIARRAGPALAIRRHSREEHGQPDERHGIVERNRVEHVGRSGEDQGGVRSVESAATPAMASTIPTTTGRKLWSTTFGSTRPRRRAQRWSPYAWPSGRA